MNFPLKIILLWLISFSALGQQTDIPYVILVSFDGFRHDYVEKYNLPNFQKMIQEGASAERLLPSFPSKTFPNHYTIVTGMYPGTHGLVDNSFYEKSIDDVYTMKKREMVENPHFYGGKPIWVLAHENNIKTASYFWVGTEAPIGGIFPDHYFIYDERVPNRKRIGQAFDWLALPEEERPHLILLYFSLVDDAGHEDGPGKVKSAVKEADNLLGVLMKCIASAELPINLVVTSDHGMREMDGGQESRIFIDSLLKKADEEEFKIVSSGTHVHIYMEDSVKVREYYSRYIVEQEKYRAYVKNATMPEHWHYNHERVGDLLLVANKGYYFTTTQAFQRKIESGDTGSWGTHGYDPYEDEDMGGIFYAKGPNIKSGIRTEPFKNIHVYPLLAQLLKINIQHKIDGDERLVEKVYLEE